MGLLDHLEELRNRILHSVVAVFVAFLGCWIYSSEIFGFLAAPIYRFLPEGTKLTFLGVTDPFILYIKVAGLAGLFVAFPYLLWQVWLFVSPGLYRREKRYAAPFVFFGWAFFVAGGAFAYYVAFPFAVQFLLDVGKDFAPIITADKYLSFLLTVILGLGVLFELPILIVLLAAIGVVTPGFLLRHFRYAVVIIFFVAALITPTPDIFNLCLFALPTIALYLLGIGASYLVTPGRRSRGEADPESTDDEPEAAAPA